MRALLCVSVILAAAGACGAAVIGKVTVTADEAKITPAKEVLQTARKGDTFQATEIGTAPVAAAQDAGSQEGDPSDSSATVRFDGLYVSKDPAATLAEGKAHSFLRFYPEGLVLEAVCQEKPASVAKWLTKSAGQEVSRGAGRSILILRANYKAGGSVLRFSQQTDLETVDFFCTLSGGALLRKGRNHISGAETSQSFDFVEISSEKPAEEKAAESGVAAPSSEKTKSPKTSSKGIVAVDGHWEATGDNPKVSFDVMEGGTWVTNLTVTFKFPSSGGREGTTRNKFVEKMSVVNGAFKTRRWADLVTGEFTSPTEAKGTAKINMRQRAATGRGPASVLTGEWSAAPVGGSTGSPP